jgi:hypothetical protein
MTAVFQLQKKERLLKGVVMATGNDRTRTGDRTNSTKNQEELDMRHKAHTTGQERDAMPDTPDGPQAGPDATNTDDPKPFPSEQRRSGPGRKFNGQDDMG